MTVLRLHSEPVQEAWLDPYGHLNEAYYLVPFSNTAWLLQDHFGIGVDYFERTGGAMYTVETHLRYLQDVRAPAVMDIEAMVLAVEVKKVRVAYVMKVDGIERATCECLWLHYDTREGRTAPLPEEVQVAMQAACPVDLPDWAGRSVSLSRQ